MMRRLLVFILAVVWVGCAWAGITVDFHRRPAQEVFAEIMRQSGRNFVYNSDLLRGLRLSVQARDEDLESVLRRMFEGTDVEYAMRGRNVVLRRRKNAARPQAVLSGYVREAGSGESLIGAYVVDAATGKRAQTNSAGFYSLQVPSGTVELRVECPGYPLRRLTARAAGATRLDIALESAPAARELEEVVVTADRNRTIARHSADIGRINLTRADILSTPTVFGEPDVIKTIQQQPGVSAGVEGLAGMYVHGGDHDENLYMLDNVPLYQVNHFAGLFSAFNTEAIKNVDFYKTSFPAKYSGRLSSILEVHTKDGSLTDYHGSARLGLTSGAFSIDGPIWRNHTSFSLAVRRSWYDVLTIPGLAIYNAVRPDKGEKTIAGYAFTDINARVNHHFSDHSELHAMFYFGQDYLKGGSRSEQTEAESDGEAGPAKDSDIARLRWGNLVGSLGWNYSLSPSIFLELTAAASHYSSSLRHEASEAFFEPSGRPIEDTRRESRVRNSITDFTLRADWGWTPTTAHRVGFGANLTLHHFRPQASEGLLAENGTVIGSDSYSQSIGAREAHIYVADDWTPAPRWRVALGFNGGLFAAAHSPVRFSWEPRASLRWLPSEVLSLKVGYSRMSQFVHQLTESSISLPTDKWVPITGSLKAPTSDKISLGAYVDLPSGYSFSAEAYMKWTHNVVDYRDDYFLLPLSAPWDELLCSGRGRAKGLDFSASKRFGAITATASYSLMWANRRFADKNGGRPFPARFDNRHKINLSATWRINSKWEVNAAWTGMSGNMTTLSLQQYQLLDAPDFPHIDPYYKEEIDYISGINNVRLPFYHRLDISLKRTTRRGYWTFSLFNAYCNMNVVAIQKEQYYDHQHELRTRLRALRLIPLLPSVAYTWLF